MSVAEALTIRRATPSDAAGIAAIYNEAVLTTTATFETKPETVEDRTHWLQSHCSHYPVLVAEDTAGVVGWASLSPWSDRCGSSDVAETSFYVMARARGRGIGRALKRALIQVAREEGFHTLLARVAEGSDASMHINLTEGFVRAGILKQVGSKFGRRLDVHILQLMLRHESSDTECVPASICRS